MPNWSVTTNDVSVPAGVAVGVMDLLYLTIVPASGYTITPGNFTIGEATETYYGSGKWIGGNVDNVVQLVQFVQDGLNVKAKVTIEPTATLNADSDIYIDIDESIANPVTNDVFGVCVSVKYPYSANAAVTITLDADGNTAIDDVLDGSVSSDWIKKISRYENGLTNFHLFLFRVTPSYGYHITDWSANINASIELEDSFGMYQDITSQGVRSVFIYYTQTAASQTLSPCDLINMVNIGYTVAEDSVTTTNTVHGVTVNAAIGSRGGDIGVKVLGDVDTQYSVTVRNGTTNDYYNWDGTYGSSSASKTGTIGSSGSKVHNLHIPESNSSVDYNIILSSVGGSTLAAGVPTSTGDLKVTQYGTLTLTMRPRTSTSYNFGTLPSNLSIKRSIRYTGDSYTETKIKTAIIKGKTSGVGTRVKLTSLNSNLAVGMRVIGANIPHDTFIEKIDKNLMILNRVVDLATVQDIRCKTKTTDTVPFSFTILPNSTPNTLSVNTSNTHRESIWGLHNVILTANDNSSGTTIKLVDSRGVVPGMEVTGDGVSSGTYVSSIDYVTGYVILNQSANITTGQKIFFKGANNPSVSVAHVDAEMSGSNVVISGYLEVPRLDNTAYLEINLDDIITVT